MNQFVLGVVILGMSTLAQAQDGTVNFRLSQVQALQMNGSPAGNSALLQCERQYVAFLGERVKVTYSINGVSSEKANAFYRGINTALFPLGISGYLDFMSDSSFTPDALQRVCFDMTEQYSEKSVKLSFINKADPDGTQCILSGYAE